MLAALCQGNVIGLWMTGVEVNITALTGTTMIIGIGIGDGVFPTSWGYAELAHAVSPREASRNRLRHITMTTLAAILTLLALAIGHGSGI